MQALAALLEPLDVQGVRFKNRIVMAPMGSCQSDAAGFVTDQSVAYYRRRAEGGVGGITVEAALVTPEAEGHEPRLHDADHVPGMRRIADAVREHGAAVGIQLMHPGRQVVRGRSVAPSPVRLNSAAPVPDELTAQEIAEIVERYAVSAKLAEEAGFEYVEVHGAHGYLPSNFLSPLANLRTDAYGGSLERRARFALEVARAIVESIDIPLFWRLGGTEASAGGYMLDQQIEVAQWLESAGVACLSVSAGTWHTLQTTVAPMFVKPGHMVQYADAIRKAVSVPVIAVGRLDDPDLAAQVVAQGSADLILIGRGLIADPDWVKKLQLGDERRIRPCIACNACVDLVGQGLELRCAVNPEAGLESRWEISPADAPRRVMVVGSGPAGMEAARIARIRGHDVVLFERNSVIGGKLDVASRAPSKADVLRYRDYQTRALADLDVEIRTGVEVGRELVEREDPDVVLVATGASATVPPISGVEGAGVVDAQELLYGRVSVDRGARIVIVGGSATGCETAELLLTQGMRVTIVEMLSSIGQGIEQITRRHLIRVLRSEGAEILTRSRVMAISPGQVRYEAADGSVGEIEADVVALAVGWQPLGAQLSSGLGGREVHVFGDALCRADFVAAVSAGAAVGLAI